MFEDCKWFEEVNETRNDRIKDLYGSRFSMYERAEESVLK